MKASIRKLTRLRSLRMLAGGALAGNVLVGASAHLTGYGSGAVRGVAMCLGIVAVGWLLLSFPDKGPTD